MQTAPGGAAKTLSLPLPSFYSSLAAAAEKGFFSRKWAERTDERKRRSHPIPFHTPMFVLHHPPSLVPRSLLSPLSLSILLGAYLSPSWSCSLSFSRSLCPPKISSFSAAAAADTPSSSFSESVGLTL